MQNRLIIVAAVDLDARAAGVIQHAAKLAALCQGDLLVAHVVDYSGGYEGDHVPLHRTQGVIGDMVDHARASLADLVLELDLPAPQIAIRVEPGPTVDTLVALVAAVQPRYLLLGHSRWGALSPTSGLAGILESRSSCEILVVPRPAPASRPGLVQRLQHWLTSERRPVSPAAR